MNEDIYTLLILAREVMQWTQLQDLSSHIMCSFAVTNITCFYDTYDYIELEETNMCDIHHLQYLLHNCKTGKL